jgi:phosphatidylethanolamine-binding protein (PEBP) family uncharacterized protein
MFVTPLTAQKLPPLKLNVFSAQLKFSKSATFLFSGGFKRVHRSFFKFLGLLIFSSALMAETPKTKSDFVLTSSVMTEGGSMPREFTGDGASISPPLEWKGAPAGTKSFVIIMHHFPHEGDPARWYWILYNIPNTVTSLAKATKGVGVNGSNCVGPELAYAPPHSKGPGVKKYTITVYALSAQPKLTVTGKQITRDAMLAAIKDITVGQAELNFTYDRTDVVAAEKAGDASSAKPSRR